MAFLDNTGLARLWQHILAKVNERLTVDTSVSEEGTANLINADSLGGVLAKDYALKEELNEAIKPVDPTLTQEGLAAESKATGNRIAALENNKVESINGLTGKNITLDVGTMGAVLKTGDTMTGALITPATYAKGDYPSHGYMNADGTPVVLMQVDASNHRLAIHQKRGGANVWDSNEAYLLPDPNLDQTATVLYDILTSKNSVTVAQGGTGASDAATARTNLGITPGNIGALPLTGGTLTGLLVTPNLTIQHNGQWSQLELGGNGSFYGLCYVDSVNGHLGLRIGNLTSGFYENYHLVSDTGLTANKDYTILSTKAAVTIAQGGTGATTRAAASRNIFEMGYNPITSADDTASKWGSIGQGIAFYTTANLITDQPAQYGILANLGFGSEVFQLWHTQPGGEVYYRGGNGGSGWSGTWKKLLDSSNFTSTVTPAAIGAALENHTHDYVPYSRPNATVITDVNTIYNTSLLGGTLTNAPYGHGAILTMCYRMHAGHTKPDYAGQIFMHGAAGNRLMYRNSTVDEWNDWRVAAHCALNTAVGSSAQPVYVDSTGELKACSALSLPLQPTNIEFIPSTTASHGGYIDFHFNGSNADFTSRIIEDESGILNLNYGCGVKLGTIYTPPVLANDDINSIVFSTVTNAQQYTLIQSLPQTNQIRFVQKNGGGSIWANNEHFSLPAPDLSRTGQYGYEILTTKSAVTIPQGGTGATDAPNARKNLLITSLKTTDAATTALVQGIQVSELPATANGTQDPHGGILLTAAVNNTRGMQIANGYAANSLKWRFIHSNQTSDAGTAGYSPWYTIYHSGNVTNASGVSF